MKILSIAGRNLNSLRLDFKVDFSDGVLRDCGIFAITGPTGAGKTTLLDAITLALYGRTPRSVSDEDIISYGAGEAWAEVVFQTAEGCFKSEWKVRRARSKHDGAVQQSTMEVSSYPDGKILTQKKREAQEKVKDLIKLEYDQFLKSVLLAQGAFKAFLDAKESERGEMLEKISDTSLYSKLSKRAFERKKKEEHTLELLRNAVGNVVVFTEEERADCVRRQDELKNEEINYQKELADFQTQLSRLQTIRNLKQKKEQAEQEVDLARLRIKQEQINLQRWESHLQVAGLESQWNQYQQKKNESATGHQAIIKYQDTIEVLTRKIAESEKSLAEALEQADNARRLREEKMPAIHNAIMRKADMLTEKKQLDNLHQQLKTKTLEQTACNTKILQNEASLDKDKKTFTGLESWLIQNEVYVDAADDCTQSRILAGELKRSIEDYEQSKSAFKKSDEQISTARQQLDRAAKDEQQAGFEQFTLVQLKEKTSVDLGRLRNQLQIHSEKNSGFLEKTVRNLEEQQDKLSRQEFLAEHLSMLHEGELCPLCGSREHPNQTLSIAEVQSNIGHIKTMVKQYQAEIKANVQQQKAIEKILANLDEYLVPEGSDQQELPENFEMVFSGLANTQRSMPKMEGDVAKKITAALQLKENLAGEIARIEIEKLQAIERSEQFQNAIDKQVKSLTEIADRYELQFELKSPARLPETLKKFSEEFLQKVKEQSILSGAIPELDEKVTTLKFQAGMLSKDLAQLQVEIENKSEVIRVYDKEINLSHEGYASPEAARDKLIAMENSANSLVKGLGDQLNVLRQQEGKVQGEKINAGFYLKDLESSIEKLLTELRSGLRELGLAEGIDLIDKYLLKGNERLTLEKLYRMVYEKLALAVNQFETYTQQLEQLQALETEADTVEDILEKIAGLQETVKTVNQELGSLKQLLKADDEKQLKIKEGKKGIINQQIILDKWSALSGLIGSADGKKFNQFAQGLTLDRLITISNHHLQLLNDRYRLKRNINDQGLRLQIVDQYQADNEREINTLSGGESFLVSLALALGLSEMTSKLTTIDSLFIDEGFGTLDADTLEVALSALRGLQTGGKTIGIISHVERLKEEIYTQVEITKGADGFSTLKVLPDL